MLLLMLLGPQGKIVAEVVTLILLVLAAALQHLLALLQLAGLVVLAITNLVVAVILQTVVVAAVSLAVPGVVRGYNQLLIRQAALPYSQPVVRELLLMVLLTAQAEMVAQLIQIRLAVPVQQVLYTFHGSEVVN
jgi:hypothetical protein